MIVLILGLRKIEKNIKKLSLVKSINLFHNTKRKKKT